MGGSQTPSLASLPKIIKNYESHTAITSIEILRIAESSKKFTNLHF
ncbi:hypothetical protein ACWIUD_04085 [Helicobacter sp. 23-1044]